MARWFYFPRRECPPNLWGLVDKIPFYEHSTTKVVFVCTKSSRGAWSLCSNQTRYRLRSRWSSLKRKVEDSPLLSPNELLHKRAKQNFTLTMDDDEVMANFSQLMEILASIERRHGPSRPLCLFCTSSMSDAGHRQADETMLNYFE